MRTLEATPEQLNEAKLRESIDRLRHAEQDLQKRVADQVVALERAGGMHNSHPVYQSLFFLHRNLSKQLRRAEKELSRRGRSSREWARSPSATPEPWVDETAIHQALPSRRDSNAYPDLDAENADGVSLLLEYTGRTS